MEIPNLHVPPFLICSKCREEDHIVTFESCFYKLQEFIGNLIIQVQNGIISMTVSDHTNYLLASHAIMLFKQFYRREYQQGSCFLTLKEYVHEYYEATGKIPPKIHEGSDLQHTLIGKLFYTFFHLRPRKINVENQRIHVTF